MARKPSKAALKQLSEADLKSFAENARDYGALGEVPLLQQEILIQADRFIKKVQENLDRLGKPTNGGLSTDIAQGDLVTTSQSVEIDLGYPIDSKSAEYFDFVNKGVTGMEGGPDSPYGFKSKYPNKKMANAIKEWATLNKIAGNRDDQKYNRSALQTKRANLQAVDTNLSFAYAVATQIKKRGLPKTSFLDDAVKDSFGDDFMKSLSKAIGLDVRLYIQQATKKIDK